MLALLAGSRPHHFEPNNLLVWRYQHSDLSGFAGSVQADPGDCRHRRVGSKTGRLPEGVHASEREAAEPSEEH